MSSQNFVFGRASSKALNQVPVKLTPKYPFIELRVGGSIYIHREVSQADPQKLVPALQTIQSSVSRLGKKLNRKFRAVEHKNGDIIDGQVYDGKGMIEVVRLPDIVGEKTQVSEPVKATSNFFGEETK
jgi:hypothetical protein